MRDYGLDGSSENDRKIFIDIINDIVINKDKTIRNINLRGQTDTLISYVKDSEEFNSKFMKNTNLSKWDEYCTWVIPDIKDDKLNIIFE